MKYQMRFFVLVLAVMIAGVGLCTVEALADEAQKIELTGEAATLSAADGELGAVTLLWTNYTGDPDSGTNSTSSGKGKGKGSSSSGLWEHPSLRDQLMAWWKQVTSPRTAHADVDKLEVTGHDSTVDIVSGLNHSISGSPTGSDDAPGIATNVTQASGTLQIKKVTVSGDPATLYEISSIDVAGLVDYYRSIADVNVTSDTTYTAATIGAVDDFQVIFVENAKLKLKSESVGYGVIAVWDSTPGGGKARVEILEGSSWHGLIIGYGTDTSGNSDKIEVKIAGTASGSHSDSSSGKGNSSGTSGKGSSSGKGGSSSFLRPVSPDSLWARMRSWFEPRDAYAGSSSSGKGKGSSGTASSGKGSSGTASSGKGGGGGAPVLTSKVIGAVLLKGDDLKVRVHHSAQVLYSSAVLDMLDTQVGTQGVFSWEKWREVE